MKNKLTYILIVFTFMLYNCKDNTTKITIDNDKIIPSDTVISNIKKECNANIEQNIYNYLLCQSWNNMNETDIKKILYYSKEEKNSEILHFIEPEIPSWIYADLKVKQKNYKIKINGISYINIIDESNDKKTLTFNLQNQSKVQNYFIRKLSEDDDESYNKKLTKIKLIKPDLSKWLGNFTFDNNNYDQLFKKYTLNVTNDKIIFYEGDLKGCKIVCNPYIFNDELYLYYNASETNCTEFDTQTIDNLIDGDFILKIINKQGKRFIQSPILKIWDDNISDFKSNVLIKID